MVIHSLQVHCQHGDGPTFLCLSMAVDSMQVPNLFQKVLWWLACQLRLPGQDGTVLASGLLESLDQASACPPAESRAQPLSLTVACYCYCEMKLQDNFISPRAVYRWHPKP